MKILEVTSLAIPEVKLISFARFSDERGYFTETFRESDFLGHEQLAEFKNLKFSQANESFSKANVLRGLHFQWQPYMGKLVRPVSGKMIDLVLDIRKGSSTYGKIIAAELAADLKNEFSNWIWVPPGFAHGIFLPENTIVEYFCSGEYSAGNEAGINPLSPDLDWSLCDPQFKQQLDGVRDSLIISNKDKGNLSLSDWTADERSNNFIYGKL